jgi:uncharacterized protein YqeY
MIDVNEFIKKTMKKEIFNNNDLENKSARVILSELKTKYVDIKEEITSELQYKIIKKMSGDRNKSAEIYKEANRNDLYEKEISELNVCNYLLSELEKDLPKQMTEDEIKSKINEIISSNSNVNIGIIMKEFKSLNADKAIVSKLAKEMLK